MVSTLLNDELLLKLIRFWNLKVDVRTQKSASKFNSHSHQCWIIFLYICSFFCMFTFLFHMNHYILYHCNKSMKMGINPTSLSLNATSFKSKRAGLKKLLALGPLDVRAAIKCGKSSSDQRPVETLVSLLVSGLQRSESCQFQPIRRDQTLDHLHKNHSLERERERGGEKREIEREKEDFCSNFSLFCSWISFAAY